MNDRLQLWNEISKKSPEEFLEWFDNLTPGEQQVFYRQLDDMQEAIQALWDNYKGFASKALEAFDNYCKVLIETIQPVMENLVKAFSGFDCGCECHWSDTYGWVPEADCPIHDPDPVESDG